MLVDGVAQPPGDPIDRALQARVAERLDLPAVAAHDVVMVVAVGRRRLEARDPVTRVDALHQPKVDEGFQRAVDGGDADRPTRPAQAVVNLVRAEAAVLPSEQLDHGAAGPATAVARFGECEERVLRPRSRRSHPP